MQKFQAVLVKPGEPGTWTYLVVPFSVPKVFGVKGQVRVRGTINGVSFRGSLAPQGDGTHYLVVNREVREAAGVRRGDTVRVVLDRDTEPREIEVPEALHAALAADPKAGAAFKRPPIPTGGNTYSGSRRPRKKKPVPGGSPRRWACCGPAKR